MKICDLPYEFALSVIMSDQLHIDNNYHQNPSNERIERMRERIEEDNLSVQPFVVSLRDNKYYIIQDVDVKLALDMINGEKSYPVFCYVCNTESYAEEVGISTKIYNYRYDASKRKIERIKNEYKKIHSNA